MFPSALFDMATMPRINVAPTTDIASVDQPVVVGARPATAVFASAIESVHAEVERLEGLRELLEYSELEWSEQQREIDRFQAEMERVRQRHLKRLQRFRRIRNGFREIESQESFRAENAQSELLELRSQLNDAVAMLESARDEKFLLEDQQKTELELLAAQRQEAEARCGQLSKQLEEACVQAMELESQLADAKASLASMDQGGCEQSPLISELEDQLESLRRRCGELEFENSSLAGEVADLRVRGNSSAKATEQSVESMTWEQRKAAILEQLRLEEMGEAIAAEEAQSVREKVEQFSSEIERRDDEIFELRQLLERQSEAVGAASCSGESLAVGAAGIAMLFDADELIGEERERLKAIQMEWEDKLREAEVELSLERAKLARGRRELEQKQQELEEKLCHLSRESTEAAKDGGSKQPRRRWLKQLGLSEGD